MNDHPILSQKLQYTMTLKAEQQAYQNEGMHHLTLQNAPHIPGFELKNILGQGSFATVFLAQTTDSHQSCALKVGLLEQADRFEREVKHMNSMTHPYLLSCFASGIEDFEGHQYYWIAMPNLSGITLADLFKYGKLEKEEQWRLLMELCLGLSALHEHGIVHRDLKPANCLIADDFSIKLSDFGLSKRICYQKDQTIAQSLSHQAIGTPAYMSPEQISGENISFESDIFSFGMIMYECFNQALPFDDQLNAVQIMAKTLYENIPFDHINREIDPKAFTLLKKCLEKNPALRFKNAQALAEVFVPLAEFEIQKRQHYRNRKAWELILSQGLMEAFWMLSQRQPQKYPLTGTCFLALYEAKGLKLEVNQLDAVLQKLKQKSDDYQWDLLFLDEQSIKYKIKQELQQLLRQELMSFEFKLIEQKRLEGEKQREVQRQIEEEALEAQGKKQREEIECQVLMLERQKHQKIRVNAKKELAAVHGFWRWKRIEKIKPLLAEADLIYCPPGEFWMGSEEGIGVKDERPRHRVKLSRGFWIGETVVTQALWQAVLGWNPSAYADHPLLPVENITWYDCLWFCNQLSQIQDLLPCYELSQIQRNGQHIASALVKWDAQANGYRLPTEAEWEYAAKAGTELIYSGSNTLDEVGWYEGNSLVKDQYQPHRVKGKKANAWGLYDMSGNVWEWCHDAWDGDAYHKRLGLTVNPVYWEESPFSCVLKGGSFRFNAEFCRVATRFRYDSDYKNSRWGIRLLRYE